MKRVLFMILLLVSTISLGQNASYDSQYLKIDVGGHIDDLEIAIKMAVEPDGVYQFFQMPPVSIVGSVITLLIIDYQEYFITVWDRGERKEIELSPNSSDIVDERDLSIKSPVDYKFDKGTLVFNY